MTWMQTRSGKRFDLLVPDPSLISIEEIAVVLSRINRFSGHTKGKAYTVAQHSIHVCDLVKEPHLKLPALLHDAHEAYSGFGDVVCCTKKCINKNIASFFSALESHIDVAIASRFGLVADLFYEDEVRHADLIALATEKRDLMTNPDDDWGDLPDPDPKSIGVIWGEDWARTQFLIKYEEIQNGSC